MLLLASIAACGDNIEPPASVMFVADRTANRIVRFDGVTGDWLGELAAIDRPSSVRLGPERMLYVAGFGDSAIVRIDARTGAPSGMFFQDTEILEEPVELVFRGAELVVLGHDTHNAIVIDPSGAMVHDVGYPDMRGAHDFVFGPGDLMYVATQYDVTLGSAIQVWDLALGAMVDRFASLDQLANATGIATVDDALYITDYERGQLVRFSGHAMEILADDLVHPIGLELGPDGLLYVIDDRGIHRYATDGSYVSLFAAIGEHLVGPRSATFVLVGDL